MGWTLMMVAALVFPIGVITMIDDRKVTKRDAEVGTFLRSLGGVASAIGTTVKDALSRLDLDAINVLRREVKRLYTRFLSGIRSKFCWQKFNRLLILHIVFMISTEKIQMEISGNCIPIWQLMPSITNITTPIKLFIRKKKTKLLKL